MPFIRIFVLIIFLLIAFKAYPADKLFTCAPAKEIMREQMEAGRGWLATAIAEPGMVLQFYLNIETGDFSIIGVDGELNACKLINGHDWQFSYIKHA